MDLGRFLIETHLRTGRPIKQLAKTHDVSASWLFKLLRRYRLEGEAGLEPRSKRPHSSPRAILHHFEDEIVEFPSHCWTSALTPAPRRSATTSHAATVMKRRRSPRSGGCSNAGASSPLSRTNGRRARTFASALTYRTSAGSRT